MYEYEDVGGGFLRERSKGGRGFTKMKRGEREWEVECK
jgi:hypothetical protein